MASEKCSLCDNEMSVGTKKSSGDVNGTMRNVLKQLISFNSGRQEEKDSR